MVILTTPLKSVQMVHTTMRARADYLDLYWIADSNGSKILNQTSPVFLQIVHSLLTSSPVGHWLAAACPPAVFFLYTVQWRKKRNMFSQVTF